MQIPFTKIPMPEDVLHAATNALKAGQFVAGQRVYQFEVHWAGVCNAAHCAAVASGSAALELTLRAMLKPGSRVVVPALSFAATSFSVMAAGMEPVFVDVDEHGLIDWEQALALCRPCGLACDAIMPVYLYGQDVGAEMWREQLRPDVKVIGDMAQAHGLKMDGLDAACFSFYPSKNLGACGEAGAVVSNDRQVIDAIRKMADYGRARGDKHGHIWYGSNLRMDELQAAILIAKLSHLCHWNNSRTRMAAAYRNAGIDSFTLPYPNANHLYPVRVKNPNGVQERLKEVGIATGLHYPYTLPELHGVELAERFENAAAIAHGHITLPMGPDYSKNEIEYIIKECQHATQ